MKEPGVAIGALLRERHPGGHLRVAIFMSGVNMAAVEQRDEITTVRVWFLPNPTNWVEIRKTTSIIEQELTSLGIPLADDTVVVTATEEEIQFRVVMDVKHK